MSLILEGKTALITGSTSGIGKALAIGFAKFGANIIITGRNSERMKEVEDQIVQLGRKVLSVVGNVENYSEVKKIIDKGITEFDKIDILINSAGFSRLRPISRFPVEEFETILKTNVFGPYNFTHAIVPHMIEKEGGTIINVGTVATKVPMPKWSAYAMSKGALNTFTEFVATELKQYKITVNNVQLNMVNTPMFRLGLDEEKIKALGPMDPNLLPPYFAFFATPAAKKYSGLNVDIDLVKRVVLLKDKLPEDLKAEADWSAIKEIAEQEMDAKQFKEVRKVKKMISFLMKQ